MAFVLYISNLLDPKPNFNPKFSLLKLPLLPIKCILDSIEISDLIHLSRSSRKCYRLISQLKPLKKCTLSIEISIESIKIRFCAGNCETVWTLMSLDLQKGHPVSIWGHELINTFDKDRFLSYTNSDLLECGIDLFEYSQMLFDLPLRTVWIYSDGITNPMAYNLKIFGKVRNFLVEGKKTIGNKELKMILRTCNAFDMIVVDVPTQQDFHSDINGWSNPNIVLIHHAHWVTDQDLLSLNNRVIIIYDSQITVNACRAFVRKWYDSDDNNCSFLSLSWHHPINLNYGQFTEFNLMPFDANRRAPRFKVPLGQRMLSMRHVMDIE